MGYYSEILCQEQRNHYYHHHHQKTNGAQCQNKLRSMRRSKENAHKISVTDSKVRQRGREALMLVIRDPGEQRLSVTSTPTRTEDHP